jgi:hypothetical protein
MGKATLSDRQAGVVKNHATLLNFPRPGARIVLIDANPLFSNSRLVSPAYQAFVA